MMDFKSCFEFGPELIHLNNAGCAPVTRRAREAIEEALREHAQLGFHWRPIFLQRVATARAEIASFVGTKPDYVAMTQNCATAVSIVAHGLDLRPGDEIVTWDQEYSSNGYAWHAAAARAQAKVVVLPSEKNYEVNVDRLISAIGPRTRVVAISWVQSAAGSITPLRPVLEACERVGAWLVADVFQGLGAIPFQLSDYPGMVITTGTQKWLCGPLGHGFLAFSDERYRELSPIFQGAMSHGGVDHTDLSKPYLPSAARFEPGAPLVLTAAGTAASISCIREVGVEAIWRKNLSLRQHLIGALEAHGAEILGTRDSERSGPQLTFVPRKPLAEVEQALKNHRISYAQKLHGIRLSPHAFNTFAELDLAIACVI